MNEYLKKYAQEAKNSDKTCFRCYYYLKSLDTDKEWHDTILSVCLNPEYKWFGEQDFTFSNWYDSKDKTMQGTLIEKSKQNPLTGCVTPHWCRTGRILEDLDGCVKTSACLKSMSLK